MFANSKFDFFTMFILFLVVELVHKTIAVLDEFGVPKEITRYHFNVFEVVAILGFLTFYKLNPFLKSLLLILLIAPVRYFLFNQNYIYYFINKNDSNNKIVNVFSSLGKQVNIMDITIILFALAYIFLQ